MNTDTLKILLIEDEIADADFLEAILTTQNLLKIEINHVKRLQEALWCLSRDNFDAILLDLSLPDSQKLQSVKPIKEKALNTAIIVLTYLNDQNFAIQALREGVQDYLVKGKITSELLIRSIRYAIERQKTEVSIRQDALMKKMLDRIRQSLDLQEILDSTVIEISKFLATDRVFFYRYKAGDTGEIISESKQTKLESYLSTQSEVKSLKSLELSSLLASSGNIRTIEDVSIASCKEICTLEDHQVRSVLTLAIWRSSVITESLDTSNYLYNEIEENFLPFDPLSERYSIKDKDYQSFSKINYCQTSDGDRLWGMLVAHNYNTPRKWQEWEIDFLQKLTTQIAIAIQQSELYRKLQSANKQLERLAILDGLTGVANRRYFDRILQNEWQRLSREQKYLSLILCDIDYFKFYNDTYGHPAGDRCLKDVAKILQKSIKRPADLVARYGGEEFAIILPDTNTQGALFVANKVRQHLASLKLIHEKSKADRYVTLSIGIATQLLPCNESLQDLVKQTDNLLYKAKEQGRNCIAINNLE